MYVFTLIVILLTAPDTQRIVRYESPGYPTYALCHRARQIVLDDLAQRQDLNGLYADLCSMKL